MLVRIMPAGVRAMVLAIALALAVPLATATAGEMVFVQQDGVDLHQAPSPGAPVVAELHQGQELESRGQRGDWVNVAIAGAGGARGWVHHTLVGDEPPSS